MESILLLPVMHRGGEQILIRFPDIKALNDAARKLPVLKWSRTYKSWFMSLNEENYKRIWKALHWLATLKQKI